MIALVLQNLLGMVSAAIIMFAPSAIAASLCDEEYAQLMRENRPYLKNSFKFANSRAHKWITDHKCLSCHTVLPMAFSHPYIKNSATENAMKAARKYISSRADNFSAVSHWYRQKAGGDTEVVISALMIASEESGRRTSPLAKKVFKNLINRQGADGSWEWLNFNNEPFESEGAKLFGNTMAMLAFSKANRDTLENPAVINSMKKLKNYLKLESERGDLNLFDKACLLWANGASPEMLPEQTSNKFLKDILRKQSRDGGFNTNALGNWEKQNTDLASGSDPLATSLILTAIKQNEDLLRLPEVKEAYNSGLEWLAKNINENGEFITSSVNDRAEFRDQLMTDFATNLSAALLSEPRVR